MTTKAGYCLTKTLVIQFLSDFLFLGEYVRAFRQVPHDPLVTLCLGLQYLHLACQRFPRSRHTCVVQVGNTNAIQPMITTTSTTISMMTLTITTTKSTMTSLTLLIMSQTIKLIITTDFWKCYCLLFLFLLGYYLYVSISWPPRRMSGSIL